MTRINQNQPSTKITSPPKKAATTEATPVSGIVSDSLRLSRPAESKALTGIKKTYETTKSKVVAAHGYAQTGVLEITQAIKTGDWNRPLHTLVDPTLDASALGPDDLFQDKTSGRIGMLLTNRLGIGESVSLGLDAGATIPLEEFLIPNAKLDQGGSLKLSRIQKRDEAGKLLTEPKDANGNPPTLLNVELELRGVLGGSYAAKAGFDGSLKVGKWKAGVNATAGAEAEAGTKGRVVYGYAFDPNNAQDMDTMSKLVGTTAASTASMAIPGIGPLLSSAGILLDDNLNDHLVTITGEGSLYAQASARAKVTAGISRTKKSTGVAEAEDLKTKTKKLLTKLGTEMRVAMMAGGAAGAANFGYSKNLQTGERTVSVGLDGMAGLNGRLPLFNVRSIAVKGSRTLAFTYDKDDNLKGVQVRDEVSKAQFNRGLRGAMEDMLGCPFDEGLISILGDQDTIRTTYNLSPAEFEKLDAKSLGEALLNRKKPESVEVTSIHRDIFELKGALDLHLGAQLGIRGGIEGIHEQESGLR